MNLFPTRVVADGHGGVRLAIADQSIPVSQHPDAGRGGRLTGGVRPEDLLPAPSGGDAIAATVEHVEWLGHETLVYARVGGPTGAVPLVVRLSEMRAFARGDVVHLQARRDRVYVFGEDGAAVGVAVPSTTAT